jgi:glycosyltransferase involved in cell wall biosynthesis
MSTSSERRTPAVASEQAGLGSRWREQAERSQEEVLPDGSVTISCSAPRGVGGLGRHMKEVADALERRGQAPACICDWNAHRTERQPRAAALDPAVLLTRLPIPLSPGLRTRAFAVRFDTYAAERLPAAEHLIAFNGQASAQFKSARRAGYSSLSLLSANSHLRRVLRQHRIAQRRYPIEGSWASRLLRRNEHEYAQADRIYVASQYTLESFLEQGVPASKLVRFRFTPDPRYRVEQAARRPGTFNIVYVGSLTVAKGVPLLIDAVRRLPHSDLRLQLVGGWATRGMRRFVQSACARDPRISSRAGDPLPRLRAASLYVHPSYEDGFAYAPAEALACGVPTVVSEDTGMKELIDARHSAIVAPTGDLDALSEIIDAAYRREPF